jgi:peptidyl-prolyl cis-trans isomerase D
MMKLVHSRGGKLFLGVLFFFMSLSLLSFGLTDIGGYSQPNAAKVGDFTITATDLDQEFSEAIEEKRRDTGTFITRPQALEQGMLEQSLARLILRRQMQQAAKDAGVAVTDETVATIIRNNSGFKNPEGQFDRERFSFIIEQAGLTPERYADIVRVDTLRGQMSQAVASFVPTPELMLDALREFQGRSRNVSYVRIGEKAVTVTREPTDEELQTVYDQNVEKFSEPERREVTVLGFGPADVAGLVEVDDADIEAEYNRQLDRFKIGERRRFEQILVDSAEDAQKISEAADGRSLEESSKAVLGDKAPSVLQVDWTERGTLLPEIGDAVFALKVGEVSQPIETGLGTHIVQVTGVQEAGTRPLAEVREALAAQLQRQNAADKLFEISAQVEQMLVAQDSLEDIAAKFNLQAHKLEGLGEDGSLAAFDGPLPPDAQLMADEAFYLEPGEVSPLLEGSQGTYLAVRLESIKPAVIKQLDEVKDEVTTIWQEIEQRSVAAKAAEALNKALAEGKSWDDAKQAAELAADAFPTETAKQLLRSEKNDFPPAAVRTAFDLGKIGDSDRLRIGDEWYVLRLDEVSSEAIGQGASTDLRSKLKDDLVYDLLSQYQRVLDKRYPARINYRVVNAFHKPTP